jgi:hypothetical protein
MALAGVMLLPSPLGGLLSRQTSELALLLNLAMSAGGIVLIWAAVKRLATPGRPNAPEPADAISAGTAPPPPSPRAPGQVPLHRIASDQSRSTAPRASSVLFGVSSALLSAIMILIGLVLLLPGMCAGFFLVTSLRHDQGQFAQFFGSWIFLGFVVSAGGVGLIVAAVILLRASRH